LVRIHGKLLDEMSSGGELDDFAGLVGIGIDRIIIGNQKVTERRHTHSQRSVEVSLVLVDDLAGSAVIGSGGGIGDGEHGVVRGCCHVKKIVLGVVDQPSWSVHEGNRIALEQVAGSNRGLVLHSQLSATNHHVEADDLSAQPIGDESIDPSTPEVINGHVPRAIDEVLVSDGLYLLAKTVDNQQRTVTRGSTGSIRRGEAANDHQTLVQHTQGSG